MNIAHIVKTSTADMVRTTIVDMPHFPRRTADAVVVDLMLNCSNQYAAVLEVGVAWRDTINGALAVASFVLGRPVARGAMTLV